MLFPLAFFVFVFCFFLGGAFLAEVPAIGPTLLEAPQKRHMLHAATLLAVDPEPRSLDFCRKTNKTNKQQDKQPDRSQESECRLNCPKPPVCVCVSLRIHFPACRPIGFSVYPCAWLSIHTSICASPMYRFISLPACLLDLSIYLSICLSIYLFIYLSIYLFVCLSIYLSIVDHDWEQTTKRSTLILQMRFIMLTTTIMSQ